MRDTHFVEADAPAFGYERRALCGAVIDVIDKAIAPTCAECRAKLQEQAAPFDRLRQNK